MGIIALTQGISIAIERAYKDAPNAGTIDGVKPISAVNTTLYMYDSIGIEVIKPATIDGNIKHMDSVRTKPTNPVLLKPISLMTPISKVFVSTEISSKEYIRSTETTMKINKRILNTRPIDKRADYVSFIASSRSYCVCTR